MRVALYVRVSTSNQVHDQTIDQQLERLSAYAQDQGWSLTDTAIFRDDGWSGARLRRPGLDRLRDTVQARAFDRILVTAPDRLARNYVHQMLLIEEFEHAGCWVEFLERPHGPCQCDDMSALARQRLGNRRTDAARGAGDEGNAGVERF